MYTGVYWPFLEYCLLRIWDICIQSGLCPEYSCNMYCYIYTYKNSNPKICVTGIEIATGKVSHNTFMITCVVHTNLFELFMFAFSWWYWICTIGCSFLNNSIFLKLREDQDKNERPALKKQFSIFCSIACEFCSKVPKKYKQIGMKRICQFLKRHFATSLSLTCKPYKHCNMRVYTCF